MAPLNRTDLERPPSPISTHQPTGDYTYRLPSPHRITVPAAPLNERGLPNLSLGPLVAPPEIDLSFIPAIDYENFIKTNALIEWKYECRREAQKILPYLYLGPMQAAKDVEFLRREGITMVLAVRHIMSSHARFVSNALKVAGTLGLATNTIDIADNAELIATFPRATRMINQHLIDFYQEWAIKGLNLLGSGKVLVLCESGLERSSSIVAAYLMEMFPDCDPIKSIQIIHAQRFCVNFDEEVKSLLQTYHDIIQARRAVTLAEAGASHGIEGNGAATSAQVGSGSGSKRRLDDGNDSDVDMEGGYTGETDAARFENRAFAAPFRDAFFE